MIHPAFFISKTMNDQPVTTMMTFAGIWCWADDYGRGEDDPALVKAAVWVRRKSMTEAKVAAAMDALVEDGTLCRYEVNGFGIIHVTHWREHQTVSHPTPSKLPPCPIHEAGDYETFLNGSDPKTERFRSLSRNSLERLLPSVVKASSVQISAGQVSRDSSSVAYLPSPRASVGSAIA
jgi:hypothetical protein